MKPAWDSLAKEYDDHASIVIADVDCTASENEDLCSKYGVRGYPTIKYMTGSTDPLGDDYEGGRSLEDLQEFVKENLGPSCGPANLDLCNDEQKAEIKKFSDMDADELQKLIDGKVANMEKAEETFKSELEKLQAAYEKLVEDKDAAIAAEQPDLKVMRAVAVANAAGDDAGDAKDEL